MVRILLVGCNGRMGSVVTSVVSERSDCTISAGIDIDPVHLNEYPVYKDFSSFDGKADVIIDFSHPSSLPGILEFAISRHIPAVIATTGLKDEDILKIKKASEKTAMFFSYNMSLGINLILDLVKKAAPLLADSFDIEIVEAHHNQKIDAPSGTAIMIGNAIRSVLNEKYEYEYDRHDDVHKRNKKEIGMHSIRGGSIVGEHEVIFAGRDEIITISHSARSKEIFAVGAVRAALFIKDKTNGLYDMSDVISNS